MAIVIPALGVIAAVAVLIALSYAYNNSLGAVLRWISQALLVTVTLPWPIGRVTFTALSKAVASIDNEIRDALAAGIQGLEWAWHAMIHAVAVELQQIGDSIEQVAQGALAGLDDLRRITIPALLDNTLRSLRSAIGLLQRQMAQVLHDLAHLSQPLEKVIYRDVPQAAAKVATLPKIVVVDVPNAVSKAVAGVLPRLHGIDESLSDAWKRLRTIGRTLTPAGILGLVGAAVFSQFGLGWLKCSNVNKVGKSVCGMNAGVLEGLLSGLLALFGTFSLVEFAKYLQPVVRDVGGGVTYFWRAEIEGKSRDRALGSPTLSG